MSNDINNVKSLFVAANQGGDIGSSALQVLAIPDLGKQIQAGLGVPAQNVDASEVTLVTLLVDDSTSIRFASNEQNVRDGVNIIISSLKESKQSASVLFSVRTLNNGVLTPYAPLDQVEDLTVKNYQAGGGTPLYDQSVVVCGQAVAKVQQFADGGVVCRSVVAFITDGEDAGSRTCDASSVAKVVHDMLLTEAHIVIGMGIDDGHTDFRKVFLEMGILPEWILTPKNTPSEIRRAFAVVSQSAVRASQGAQGFSQTAATGFTG